MPPKDAKCDFGGGYFSLNAVIKLAMSISCRRRSTGRTAPDPAAAADAPDRGRPDPPPPPAAALRLPCAIGRMSRAMSLAPVLPVDAWDWDSGRGPSSTLPPSLESPAPAEAAAPTRRRLCGTPAPALASSRLAPRGTPGRRRVTARPEDGTNSSDDDANPSLPLLSSTTRSPWVNCGRKLPSRRLRD